MNEAKESALRARLNQDDRREQLTAIFAKLGHDSGADTGLCSARLFTFWRATIITESSFALVDVAFGAEVAVMAAEKWAETKAAPHVAAVETDSGGAIVAVWRSIDAMLADNDLRAAAEFDTWRQRFMLAVVDMAPEARPAAVDDGQIETWRAMPIAPEMAARWWLDDEGLLPPRYQLETICRFTIGSKAERGAVFQMWRIATGKTVHDMGWLCEYAATTRADMKEKAELYRKYGHNDQYCVIRGDESGAVAQWWPNLGAFLAAE